MHLRLDMFEPDKGGSDDLWKSMAHTKSDAPDVGEPTKTSAATSNAGAAAIEHIGANGATMGTGQTEATICGVRVIAHSGVHAGAIDRCGEYIRQEIGHNAYAQHRMASIHATVYIIPAMTAMTAEPEFASLAGQTTFDGRHWEQVRGSGGAQYGNQMAVAVGEESLLTGVASTFQTYGPGYSVGMHEFAHLLHDHAMTGAEFGRVAALYQSRVALQTSTGTWQSVFTDEYASRNADEYYAQATNCFFGRNAGLGQNGAAWLLAHDPDMHAFLAQMYQRNHDGHGAVMHVAA